MPSKSRFGSIFTSLADKDLLIPYFRNSLLSNDWPDKYTIEVDSSPYYGFGDGMFHPSTHAVTTSFNEAGERYLYYLFHPDHRDKLIFEPRDVRSEMTLAMGSALHAVLQTQFQQCGILRPENIEVEYVIPEHHVRGRIDMIVDHPTEGEVVTEIKTINSRAYDFQKQVKPEWDAQLSMALFAQDQDQGVLLALESGHPYRMREYRVDRNDRLLESIFGKFDRVREALHSDTPPEHCCPMGSDTMKACPARYECWLAKEVVTNVA